MPENKSCKHTATTKIFRNGFFHYVCKTNSCKREFTEAEYKEHVKNLIKEEKK